MPGGGQPPHKRNSVPGAQGPRALLKDREAGEEASDGAHDSGATGIGRGHSRFVLTKIEDVVSVTANKKKKKRQGRLDSQ